MQMTASARRAASRWTRCAYVASIRTRTSAHRLGQQQPPQQRRAAGRADPDLRKSELAEQTLERAPRVQVQVIAEGLREALDPAGQQPQSPMRGRREQ